MRIGHRDTEFELISKLEAFIHRYSKEKAFIKQVRPAFTTKKNLVLLTFAAGASCFSVKGSFLSLVATIAPLPLEGFELPVVAVKGRTWVSSSKRFE